MCVSSSVVPLLSQPGAVLEVLAGSGSASSCFPPPAWVQQRSGAASRDDSLRRENERLEKELGRVRHQLSRTVDVMFAQPRTSTPVSVSRDA